MIARRLADARGDEPADLVLTGGMVFSVFTRQWIETDVRSSTNCCSPSSPMDEGDIDQFADAVDTTLAEHRPRWLDGS